MPHADFVHLRVHSAYSLSEGAIKADKIAALARRPRMPAVAITDSGNLFGALEFSQACAAAGRAADHRLPDRACARRTIRVCRRTRSCCSRRIAAGLANLQRLSSLGFLETEPGLKPQLPLDALAAHAAGLLLLTGGAPGPIGRLLAEGRKTEAEALLARLAEAFPGPHR